MVHSLGLVGIGSITLGALSFCCMVAGIFLVWVPFLGAMLGFLAPVLALFGIVLGGVALSRAREGGRENESLAIGGLITNIVAFVPSSLVAVTCGLCSACWTGVVLTPHDAGPHVVFPDAGASTWAPPSVPRPSTAPGWPSAAPPSAIPDPASPSGADPAAPPLTAGTATEADPTTTSAPGSSGPALPPPPLAPGPNVRAH